MMKKTIKLSASLLFAAVLLASCGEVISGPSGEGTYMLTVETKRPDRPLTKSLDITTNGEGKQELKATWDPGDVITVTKWDRVLGTLSPQTSESSTIFSGEVTGELKRGHILYLDWPEDGSNFDYRGQDGTLETIASRYDYLYGEAGISTIGDGMITCTPVTLRYGQAIVKFILKDSKGNPVYPDRVVLSAQDKMGNSMIYTHSGNLGQLAVDINQSAGGTNEIYIAVKQYSDANVFKIEAYVPGYVYREQKRNIAFESGQFYEEPVSFGAPDVDRTYTLDNFGFNFDFGGTAQKWPVFVFFDGITTGYWYDADGKGKGAGSFVDLGGTVLANLAGVKKVTAVSMPHWTNQTPVYSDGKWTFGKIEGWQYIAHSNASCEYSLVEGAPRLTASISLAAPQEEGREIRVYNNATNVRFAYNNLIPMGLASISSDGNISEVNADSGGWISLVRDSDPESTSTYGYAKLVNSPTSFAYFALERNSGGSKTYYHLFKTSSSYALGDYNKYYVVEDNNGLDWIQVGKDHYVTFSYDNKALTWWTTNLSADRYNPEPHPWSAPVLSWCPDNEANNQWAADRPARSLSNATFYANSELPSINSDGYNYRMLYSRITPYKLRICGVNGVVIMHNPDPSKYIFLAVPDMDGFEFVYYYNSYNDYIVYRASDYYWAKEYNTDQTHQQFRYDGSHGAEYWNLYLTSAININFQEPGGAYIPPYRFPYAGTGHDGYGLPDFGCSAEPINGSLQPVRVYLPARPVKK
ncbi:MAG: hypothetical protein J6X89_06115 [Bacteroidales bacterium]|nr:hypothetical protein [Bacteroidales bacterium]